MQVSQIASLDTHVVLGGESARAFSISDAPEFFTVLSDTLYQHKKLAVVREVICNAYDAHIVTGKTDVPVQVTLTDKNLEIRDFGLGIPDDKIAPIYCVYGASTKAADGKQTGGFGLGSKAPFAYSDHFTVTSCHNGEKTVYAISRGGAETGGRPEVRAVVRMKTDETGLSVSIPLQENDRNQFEILIRRVTQLGGMNVSLNGVDIPKIEYDRPGNAGFVLIPSYSDIMRNLDNYRTTVFVRYGTVVYPVDAGRGDSELDEVLRSIGFVLGSNRAIIVQAPEHSIGVTPSRESLSYTKKTMQTLVQICTSAFHHIKRQMSVSFANDFDHALAKNKEKGADKREVISLMLGSFDGSRLDYNKSNPSLVAAANDGYISSLDTIGSELADNYLSSFAASARKTASRLVGKHHPELARLLRRWSPSGSKYDLKRDYNKFMLKRLSKIKALIQPVKSGYFDVRTNSIKNDRFETIFDSSQLVADRIVVSRILRDAYDDTAKQKFEYHCEYHTGYYRNFPVFTIKSDLPEARIKKITKLANKLGFQISFAEYVKPVRKAPAPKPNSGFLRASSFWRFDHDGKIQPRNTLEQAELERVPTAKSFIRVTRARNARHLFWLQEELRRDFSAFANLYPDTVLATDADEEKKLIKLGARPVLEIVHEELKEATKLQSAALALALRLQWHAGFDGDRYYYGSRVNDIVKLCSVSAEFAKLVLGVSVKYDEKTERIAKLGDAVRTAIGVAGFSGQRRNPFTHLTELYNKLKEKYPKIIDNTDAVKEATDFMKIIDSNYIRAASHNDPACARDVINTAKYLKQKFSKTLKAEQAQAVVKEAA